MSDNASVEPVPMSALGRHTQFSTRLFETCSFSLPEVPFAARCSRTRASSLMSSGRKSTRQRSRRAWTMERRSPWSWRRPRPPRSAQQVAPGDWVIGSDSVVRVDERFFDKPRRPRRGRRPSSALFGQADAPDERASHWRATGPVEWSHVGRAELHVRERQRGFHPVLSGCRVAGSRQLRRSFPDRRAAASNCSTDYRWSFHDHGNAAHSGAQSACASGRCCNR